MRVVFHSPLPEGFEVEIGGQRYRSAGFEPHTRRDGVETKLSVWLTNCSTCGGEMVTRSPFNVAPDSKRCEQHRRPGRPARKADA